MTQITTGDAYAPELEDALVPLDSLAAEFGVTERTLRRWLDADSIERRPYNGGKAVRWGDVPKPDTDATRWVRRRHRMSGRYGRCSLGWSQVTPQSKPRRQAPRGFCMSGGAHTTETARAPTPRASTRLTTTHRGAGASRGRDLPR